MTDTFSSFLAHSTPKVGSGGRGTHWEFFSPRLRRRVVAASSLEYDHYTLVDMDPEVKEWEPQVAVTVVIAGKEHHRVLDSVVRFWNGRCVVNEVKPEQYAKHPKTIGQLRIQEAGAQENGAESNLVTDKMISENEILLESHHKMRPWLHSLHVPDEVFSRQVLGLLAGSSEQVSILDLASELKVQPDVLCPVLVRAYLDRRVAMDIATRRFGLGTLVNARIAS